MLDHKPVLVHEVLRAFDVENKAHLNTQAVFIDATVGFGGHSIELVKRGAFVLGIDADVNALELAEKNLAKACPTSDESGRCFKLVHSNFRNIDKIAKDNGLDDVSGILIDLGVNTHQLTSKERGFSFTNKNAPLDMRLDRENQSVTAADLVNGLRKDQLMGLLTPFCEYNFANRLAKEIVDVRQQSRIKTVGDFLEIVEGVAVLAKSGKRKIKIHPATIPFMALRIAVNSELENLEEVLPKAFNLLSKKGKLIIISFHSAEDRLVKKFFRKMIDESKAKIINEKPIIPTKKEVEVNLRARSAKMRILEKI